jgi:CRP-like cAMP-binding protein
LDYLQHRTFLNRVIFRILGNMKPDRLTTLMKDNSVLEKYSAGDIFHSQDFPETLFMLKSGFVKRYQITSSESKVIELIYGPGHIFPLSQLYKLQFNIEQNQENLVYVYQAMSDIEIWRVSDTIVADAAEKDPRLFMDLFYEAGLRLKSNIERLASNALKDDYKKVAHQVVCLADEFGESSDPARQGPITIPVPLTSQDMAEQLNISPEVADAVLSSLSKDGRIKVEKNIIQVLDINLLKDVYL